MDKLDELIDSIKKQAYINALSDNPVHPTDLSELDTTLYYNMYAVYVLFNVGKIDKDGAKNLTQKYISMYKITGMNDEIYRDWLERREKAENLTISMIKEPSVRTALDIVYQMIPTLGHQKNRIDRELM